MRYICKWTEKWGIVLGVKFEFEGVCVGGGGGRMRVALCLPE